MVSIIVPVHNGAENLPELIKAIRGSLYDVEHEVIIVDNNCTYSALKLAEDLAKEYSGIKIVHRDVKTSIASVIAEGVMVTRGEVIGTINVDILQDTTLLPNMLGQISEHDIVIACRYASGSHDDRDLWHRLVSKLARNTARVVLPRIRNIKDPLSNLFLFKREVITQALIHKKLPGNVSRGIQFLPDLLVNGHYNSIVEVPYTNEKQKSGESEFSVRDYFTYLVYICYLLTTSGEFKRIVKFAVVGGTGLVINTGVLYLLTDKLGLYYLVSAALSWEASIISMFTMHELWTFRDLRISGTSNVFKRLLKFNIVRSINPVISLAILFCLTDLIGLYYLVSNLIALSAVAIWNYLASLNVVWRK